VIDENTEFDPEFPKAAGAGAAAPPAPIVIGYAVAPQTEAQDILNPPAPPPAEKP
jgi:hypothetical protein